MSHKENDKVDLKKILDDTRRDLDLFVQIQASQAIIMRARYDALLKVGFTEGQSLEIVKARGIG